MDFSTLDDVGEHVAGRLEETWPPVFWTQDEIRTALVEAMNEAVLLTGEPQERRGEVMTLSPDQTFYDNPPEAVAMVRLEGPLGLEYKRESIWDLDHMIPDWQTKKGSQIKYWFPFGMTKFGVYPRLTSAIQVVPTYIKLPVMDARPYTGAELMPFQEEYLHAFESYAAHVARLKEGGVSFQQSMALYNDYLQAMQELGKMVKSKSPIRFSRLAGTISPVTERKD